MSSEKNPPVSVTVLTRDSASHIRKCLRSLERFDEVVVLDNGSADDTLAIAREFKNVRIFESEFSGFGALKNLAASHAVNDRIFSVDSDEVVSPELAESILSADLRPDDIGIVRRRNHYRGRLIDACGWQNDDVARVYDRTRTSFSPKLVHESLDTRGKRLVPLRGDLAHYPFSGASDLITKMQFYSTLYAEEHRYRKHSSISKAAVKAATTFVRDYILKRGMFYGGDGLTISASHAAGAFYKYAKLKEANERLSVSLLVTTYNRDDALEVVLQSILAQSELPDEVIVADDGSSELTAQLVDRYKDLFPVPLIHCWHEDDGFRLAEIRNKAISLSRGEYTIIVDGDMLLHPDFVRSHKNAAWKGRFVQGSRVWITDADTDALIESKDAASIPGFFSRKNPHKSIESRLLSKVFSQTVGDVEGVKGCNIAFWRDDCFRVNGFNEDFRSWGREDTEFTVRMMNLGLKRYKIRFGAVAYHLSHPLASFANLENNDRILQRTIDSGSAYCANGIVKDSPAEVSIAGR